MIPLMKNTFFNEFETRKLLAEFIMRAPKLSMGQECENFETRFALMQGRKYAVLVNSGASANLAILQALLNLGKLKTGDEVAFSAVTWSTNVMPILQMGMHPVPVDCKKETLNSDSAELKKTISQNNIKALFITNALGLAGDLDKIRDICSQNNILLLEDSCEALGSEVAGLRTGNFGLASSFSFFVAHHMSTIEGGMVCTDDADVWEMLVQVRANGWDRNLSVSTQKKLRRTHAVESEFYSKYTFYDLAFNIRPTEITGFLGNVQLDHLSKNGMTREKNFLRIQKVVSENHDFIPLYTSHMNRVSAFALPFVCRSKELQRNYANRFAGNGIEIRPMISGNIQRQPFFKKYISISPLLPDAEHLHDCGFYCGNYPELSHHELDCIEACL